MGNGDSDGDYSVIGEAPESAFLDFDVHRSEFNGNACNEGPVVVSFPFPLLEGKNLRSVVAGKTAVDVITVKNITNEPIDLWGVKVYTSNPTECFTLALTEPPLDTSDEDALSSFFETMSLEDRVLAAGHTLKIWLSCKTKDIGLHQCILHFDVGNDRIERVVFLMADDVVSQSLVPTKPYNRQPRRRTTFNGEKVVATPLPSKGKAAPRHGLPEFLVPDEVRRLVQNKQVPEVFSQQLSLENYEDFFTTLLNIEELEMEEAMKEYDMRGAKMMRMGPRFLTLEVPGLAERRPSIVCRDYVIAKLHGGDDFSQEYKGHVHRVEAEKVFLQFANEFHLSHRNDNLYDVSFTINRLNVRRMYQAIALANHLGRDALFPSVHSRRRFVRALPLNAFYENINEEQASAIDMILKCKGFPPYIIYGPPGTGKTMTLVEAIRQVYTTRRSARILVCASSNCAADHILTKLIPHVKMDDIFRLNAYSRSFDEVPNDILPYCFYNEYDAAFNCPAFRVLTSYRIIVSTYMSSSLLNSEGVRRGHFSHIMMDESGQASEPETLIPMSNLSDKDTVIVLAGDPLQLGPVILSKGAQEYGLGKSFLERLSEIEIYRGSDRRFMTKLVRNYRCHPSILELPSTLFYEGELIACKEKDADLQIHSWPKLPNKAFPVVFYGIQGCDEREGNNPSWFNRTEASKVVKIIQSLKDGANVRDGDIGVISPYRQQVLKLKTAFESENLLHIQVGSVEQFQGQEKPIIIISTVRSSVLYDNFDRKHHLGFLSNPRRFNVAITRAQSLLIVVGNPNIICKDFHWNQLIRHCTANDSYDGCPLPEADLAEYEQYYPDEGDNPADGGPDDYRADVADCEQQYHEDLPKPATDEAEWSDGWR